MTALPCQLDFFQHLEMFVRAEKPPLCGRDHIMCAVMWDDSMTWNPVILALDSHGIPMESMDLTKQHMADLRP